MKTVYTIAHIIVGCEILTWTPPTMPTRLQATYTIFDPDFTIKLTPEFDQQPPCAYQPEMRFRWTISQGAPIYPTADPYSVLVTS